MPELTGVSLFAGIGGFDLAMERAGIDVSLHCEIDKDCRAVLARHFPTPTQFGDVKGLRDGFILDTGFEPETGILTAGWPCQGNSVAGHRKGMADPRSGLWREVARLLGDLRPRWFVGENPGRPGVLTVNGGADFLEILKSLDELGYGVAWRVLDAQNFGVPQRRRRVLVVGCLGDPARAAQVLLEPESGSGDSAESPQQRPRVASTLASSAGGGGLGGIGHSANSITSRIVETASTLQGGGKRGYRVDAESAAGGQLVVGSAAYALSSHHSRNSREQTQVCSREGVGVRRLTPLECERLQGFPDGWTEGQSDSARYRQLGNAVAVPVIEWLMERIAAWS